MIFVVQYGSCQACGSSFDIRTPPKLQLTDGNSRCSQRKKNVSRSEDNEMELVRKHGKSSNGTSAHNILRVAEGDESLGRGLMGTCAL